MRRACCCYRAAGKIFRIPEDFAACYQVSDSMYDRLEPYIRIGTEYRFRPRRDSAQRLRKPFVRRQRVVVPLVPFRIDTMTAKFLRAIGFTKRQAEAIADYNTLIGGFRDEEELCDYPIIGDSAGRRLAEYALFPERRRPLHDPVELNTADSAALRSVQRYRCEDRRGDSRLPAAAGRFLPCGATGRSAGRHREQLRADTETNFDR